MDSSSKQELDFYEELVVSLNSSFLTCRFHRKEERKASFWMERAALREPFDEPKPDFRAQYPQEH
jgi:hypothetical protein